LLPVAYESIGAEELSKKCCTRVSSGTIAVTVTSAFRGILIGHHRAVAIGGLRAIIVRTCTSWRVTIEAIALSNHLFVQ
jgi:hypothetical protein